MDLYNEVNKARIEFNSNTGMPLEEVILNEINNWENSDKKEAMIKGQEYYAGKMAIDEKKRMVVGENGRLMEDKLVSNVKLKHNFIKKLVRQKVSYLLSEKIDVQTENDSYTNVLDEIFNNGFHKLLKNIMTESINKGIAWVYPYIENNKLKFQKLNSSEIIPLWKDNDHTRLDGAIRVYEQEYYEGDTLKTITRVEFYTEDRIKRWILKDNKLIPDIDMIEQFGESYINVEYADGENKGLSWGKVPLIYFKYNDLEQPLLLMIESLIDDYNMQRSLNSDMILDTPNNIIHVRNYDGEHPGEFRKNLSTYRIGFTSDDGGMESMDVNINTEAYEKHIKTTRKDIFEFGGGVDTDFDSFGNSPSGIALEILYQDLDLDCNEIETEFQASLEYLMYFINLYILEVVQAGDFEKEPFEFIFTRNKLNNESEIIKDLNESIKHGTLSKQTVTERHPYAATDELERIEEESSNLGDDLDQYVHDLESRLLDEGEDE